MSEFSEHIPKLLQQRSEKSLGKARRRQAERRGGPIQVSYAQERFWILQQLDPSGALLNTRKLWRLGGKLDQVALEQALREIQQRHSVLRTVFADNEGSAVPRIIDGDDFALQVVDFSSNSSGEKPWEREPINTLLREEQQLPFDLAQGPLWRAMLLRLGENDNLLAINAHHIAIDGTSWPILEKELAALYAAFANGKPSPLADLAWQYSDYAQQQRELVEKDAVAQQVAELKNHLAGAEHIRLPFDFPRPSTNTYRGAEISVPLPDTLREALIALGKEQNVTLFMIMLAAFQILLSRLSGQEDIVVGSPIANRTSGMSTDLLGCFLNNLVLRSDLSGNPRFVDLLAMVFDTALDAYDRMHIPFEKVVAEIQPERSLSQTPLFNVFINQLARPDTRFQAGDITFESIEIAREFAQFDLTLYIREYRTGVYYERPIDLILAYNVHLFSVERIEEMLAQFVHLLAQIAADPQARIGDYSLVTPRSADLLPDAREPLQEPSLRTVPDLVLEWQERTPAQTAVEQDQNSWSYAQLGESARTIAGHLQERGLQQGSVVGLTGNRSFGLIAAMLGIMAAGGVLLPIDPQLPVRRQELMLKEAGAEFLLICDDPAGWETGIRQKRIQIDPQSGRPPASAEDYPAVRLPRLDGDDPAAIFFTSGTTGVPQGIVSNHKGVAHCLQWQRTRHEISPADRACQSINLGFDVLLRDVFLALTSGATLVLMPVEEIDAIDTLRWLKRKQITLLHTVPSIAQYWLSAASRTAVESHQLDTLRWVFFAGEPLDSSLVQQWRDTCGDKGQLVNLYGPTETTMVKTYYQIPDEVRTGVQPIGAPLPNTQVLVLSRGQLCGVGEAGEIVIRTPFRAIGSINARAGRPLFSINPFRDDADDLLYFTGDGGRYLPDGLLEILGRLDDQIKIRGLRIEPAEIEATLRQHPRVKDAVVVLRDDAGEKKLLAYVIAEGALAPGQLRRFVANRLPTAMTPATFCEIDAIPLTANGKVDRRALAALELAVIDPWESYVPPETSIELKIAEIWSSLLGQAQIGRNDSFFELGGHSLNAINLASILRQRFEIDLPLRTIFEYPTLAGLADFVTMTLARKLDTADLENTLTEIEEITRNE